MGSDHSESVILSLMMNSQAGLTPRKWCFRIPRLANRNILDVFLDQAELDSFIPLLNDYRPELPVGESLLADALYFLASDPPDPQRAVITAAIGCEVKVKQTIRSKAPAVLIKLIDLILDSPRDWSLAAIALFDRGAEAGLRLILGRTIGELFKRVALLFEVRNKIAHKGERPEFIYRQEHCGSGPGGFRLA